MNSTGSLLQSLLQTSHNHDANFGGGGAAGDTTLQDEDDLLLQESLANLEQALSSLAMELNEPGTTMTATDTNAVGTSNTEMERSGNADDNNNSTNVLASLLGGAAAVPPGIASGVNSKASNAPMRAQQIEDSTSDAWTLSLANFDTLEEFLQADAASKKKDSVNDGVKMKDEKDGLEEVLKLEGVLNYDENEEAEKFVATLNSQSVSLGKIPPQQENVPVVIPSAQVIGEKTIEIEAVSMSQPTLQQQQVPPPMQSLSHPMGMPPPPMHQMMPPMHPILGMPPPPPRAMSHPSMPPNIPVGMPVAITMPIPPHPSSMVHHHPRPPAFGHIPPPTVSQQKSEASRFEAGDFPPLGTDTKEKKTKGQVSEPQSSQKKVATKSQENNAQISPIRMLFNNPASQNVPTKLVTSSLMTQRDIQFVISAMLRSLTAENQDDFYYKQYLAKFNIFQGDMKEVDIEKREKFRENIETRSKEWQEEKQSLGRVVKTDVTRPRALLTAPKLSKQAPEEEKTEYVMRANLWKARALIDTGYDCFFNLLDLSSLLWRQDIIEEEKAELKKKVRSNLIKLNASFGLVPNPASKEMDIVNEKTLSLSLSLPKGKELLARCLEKGILPHPSAVAIFPFALSEIMSKPGSFDLNDPSTLKEARLLRSLLVLININQPSLSADTFITSVEKVVSMQSTLSLRERLAARLRAEVMHALMARGSQVCGNNEVWATKEASFIQALSSP